MRFRISVKVGDVFDSIYPSENSRVKIREILEPYKKEGNRQVQGLFSVEVLGPNGEPINTGGGPYTCKIYGRELVIK